LTVVGPRYRTAHVAAASVVLIVLGNSDKPRSHFDASPTSYPRRRSGNSSETPSTLTQGNGLAKGSDLEVTAERDITPAQIPVRNAAHRSAYNPDARPTGRNLGEDLLSEPLRDRATPADTNRLTCINRKEAGVAPART
jgi:hypothetical protein